MTELGWFPLSAWLPPPWCLRKGPSHQGCSETSTFNITLMTAEYSTFNSLIINVAIPPQHPQLPGNFMRKECLLCQTVVTVGISRCRYNSCLVGLKERLYLNQSYKVKNIMLARKDRKTWKDWKLTSRVSVCETKSVKWVCLTTGDKVNSLIKVRPIMNNSRANE